MARRATYLETVQGQIEADKRVLVSGPNEFVRHGHPPPAPAVLEAFSRVLSALDYDLGLLSVDESKALRQAGVDPPQGFRIAAEPGYHSLERTGRTIGFVLFPDLGDNREPSSYLLASLGELCRKKRREADLLVGISPWGYWPEQKYLKSEPANTVDILLGSGPGVEIGGVAMNKGRVWWVRAYPRGKYVLKTDVLIWPDDNGVWSQNGNIRTEPVVLTDGFAEDIDILSIIRKAQ